MQNVTQPTVPAPTSSQPPTPAPPAPPAPGAPREEWRAWRRQNRAYYRGRWADYGWWGWSGIWGWFWSLALVLVGSYYLLVNLGVVVWPNAGDVLWPSLLILLGLLLLVSRLSRARQ